MAQPPVSRPVFRAPLAAPDAIHRTAPDVSFADLVRMLAESIGDAQLALDTSSAEMMVRLAETKVDIVPRVVERIAADGSVTYEHAERAPVSLLDLGLTPTFYQFSQATVEVSMDLRVVETEDTQERGKRKIGLFAGTEEIKTDRTFSRDMRATSKVTATLVPVPRPVGAEPARATRNEAS